MGLPLRTCVIFPISFLLCSTKCYSCGKSWFMKQSWLCTKCSISISQRNAKVCMGELTLAIDKILCLKNASTWISTFFTIHICLLLNTSYLIDSYIGFTLKMESVTKNTIFGLKMMVKSGLEKFILKSLHAGR